MVSEAYIVRTPLSLSNNIYIFFWTDKVQKGEFGVDGYTVKMNSTLRKDSKKDYCFEISAPGKRPYQVQWSFDKI